MEGGSKVSSGRRVEAPWDGWGRGVCTCRPDTLGEVVETGAIAGSGLTRVQGGALNAQIFMPHGPRGLGRGAQWVPTWLPCTEGGSCTAACPAESR